MDDERLWPPTDPIAPAESMADHLTLDQIEALMEERAQAGWVWDDATHTLTDPADRDVHFRIDSISRRLSLSPKLAEQLGGMIGPESAARES